MGKLAVKRYVSLMFLIIQLVLSIFTIAGLFGGDSTPVGHTALAMIVYILPFLILANAIMLVYWLIVRHWILTAIPVLTMLCCIPYVGCLYQPGSLTEIDPTQENVKIATSHDSDEKPPHSYPTTFSPK